MRVIAGEAKGRRLAAVRSTATRPTTDRVREALFSSLGADVVGAMVLDLYAGSGALGLEALSRGAASAVFVDSDREAVAAIRANLALTNLDIRGTVVHSTVQRFLRSPHEAAFDLVFMDPPYAEGVPVDDLAGLASGGFLAPRALVILETRGRDAPPPVEGLELVNLRRYGDTSLAYLRQEGP